MGLWGEGAVKLKECREGKQNRREGKGKVGKKAYLLKERNILRPKHWEIKETGFSWALDWHFNCLLNVSLNVLLESPNSNGLNQNSSPSHNKAVPLPYLKPISIIGTTNHPNLTLHSHCHPLFPHLHLLQLINQRMQILSLEYLLHSLPLFYSMLPLLKGLKLVSNSCSKLPEDFVLN